MKLVPVEATDPSHILFLHGLLEERGGAAFISHEKLPTLEEHARFVHSKPFFYWYLISVDWLTVGAIEVTERNELGVSIKNGHRRKGYGRDALKLFLDTHQPLPAIPAIRNGRWLANVAPNNTDSLLFFKTMGFQVIQHTMALQ